MLTPETNTYKTTLTFSLLVTYHFPGSTNICLPEISTMAYVAGAGELSRVGLRAGAAAFCSTASASAAAAGRNECTRKGSMPAAATAAAQQQHSSSTAAAAQERQDSL
jgi:hypothetical protein